ncbi:MAG: FtsW/RodA/SpoVE family cell cycle protein [Arcanobacterium sp.]|nr:FtsW/RodA/SpoVE family cell cycle protein [Arcanobacterium sp.]
MNQTARFSRPKGTWQEFALLLFACAISVLGWILVDVAFVADRSQFSLTPAFIRNAGAVIAIVFIAHFLIRRLAPWADPIIFPIAVLLNGIGLVIIHRIDFSLLAKGKSAELSGQLLLSIGGIVLAIATLLIFRDHRQIRKFTYISLIVGFIMLILPLVPGLGREVYGAQIWIRLFGFSFQPAEIAKICFVIFFSGYLVTQRDNLALAGKKFLGIQLPQARHLAPILVAWLVCLGVLAFEKDFGTALLFFGMFVAMLYVATERTSWIIIGGLLSVAGVFLLLQVMPHIQSRFASWLHAFDDDVYNAAYGSYQLVQGWFGMASGGLFGTFLGEGYPTNSFAANSDFVIASIAEELGLIGATAILCLYLILILRALKTGIDLRDGFGKLLATGFAAVISLQCFVIVGGVTRIIPLTGLALPFLALGGSSLLANWIIIGFLLRLSNAARRPEEIETGSFSEITTAEISDLLADDSQPEPKTAAHQIPELDEHPTEVVKL